MNTLERNKLLEDNINLIYSHANKHKNVSDLFASSDDYVQELMLYVTERIKSFDPNRGKISTYIVTLCTYFDLMAKRKYCKQKSKGTFFKDFISLDEILNYEIEDTSEQNNYILDYEKEALNWFYKNSSLVFRKHYFGSQESFKDIAKEYNVPECKIRGMLNNEKNKLLAKYKKEVLREI